MRSRHNRTSAAPLLPKPSPRRVLSGDGRQASFNIGRDIPARRGMCRVKLVISDVREGLKTAITRVLGATRQRCRVHRMRNLLAHGGRQGRGDKAGTIRGPGFNHHRLG